MATIEELTGYTKDQRVRRFLDAIGSAEGTDTHGYNTAFGGGKIESLADHPRQLHDFTQTDGKANKTSAAGRYQFLQSTWDDVAKSLNLPDFGPESQDIAAVELLRRNGALPAVLADDYDTAIKKSGSTWASLPSSPYAQPKRSPGFMAAALDKAAQAIFPAAHAAPAPKQPNFFDQFDDAPAAPPATANFFDQFDELAAPMVQAQGAVAPAEVTTEQKIVASGPMRALKGGKDVLDAGAQMLVHAVPTGVAGAVNDATRYVNELPIIGPVTKALGMTPASAHDLDQSLTHDEQQYQAARTATGQSGIDGARLLGNIVATAPLAASMPAAAATLPGRIAAGAAGGAAFGMMNPVTQGNYEAEKLKQAGTSALFGGALSTAGAGLGRLLAPRAAQNPQVQGLLNEGVTPTPGQLVGGMAQRTEDKLMSVPVVGDAIQAARRRGQEEFNRAALNRAVEPIGGRVTAVGREGMQQVDGAISAAYDSLLPRLTFRADAEFGRELGRLQQMVVTLPEQQARQFENIVRSQVASRLTPQGAATGQNFKLIESEIGRLAREYGSSAVAGERSLGAALGELQTSLRGALSRANPHLAPELGQINQAYANYVRLQRAAGGAGAENGLFTPAQLSAAVRASDSSVRKGRFARGEALMQDLSDAGKAVMGSKVPNSGTADRMWAGLGALFGGGAINTAIPATLLAGSVPYLPGVGRAVAAALARRPAQAIQAGNQLERIAPGIAAIFGAQAGAQR